MYNVRTNNITASIHGEWWIYLFHFLLITTHNFFLLASSFTILIGSKSNFLFTRSHVMMINDELWQNEITQNAKRTLNRKKMCANAQRDVDFSTRPQIVENCLFLTFNYRNFPYWFPHFLWHVDNCRPHILSISSVRPSVCPLFRLPRCTRNTYDDDDDDDDALGASPNFIRSTKTQTLTSCN